MKFDRVFYTMKFQKIQCLSGKTGKSDVVFHVVFYVVFLS